MNDVYYISGNDEKIYLDRPPFWMQTGDFLDYEWSYKTKNERITGFKKEIAEREFWITVFGNSEAEYADNWSRIHEVFEKDILNVTPGKLYFGEYCLNCYIFASEKSEWEYDCNMHDNRYWLVTDRPFWIRESSITIPTATDPEGDGLYYDYTYDYTYGSSGLSVTFENEHFAPCNFRLTAHGPFNALEFAINGNLYRVNQSCAEGEMLILDTSARTIVKIDTYGNVWNVFGKQDFTLDNFKQIPAGENILSYGRTYQIDLTIYEERSEPKWSAW